MTYTMTKKTLFAYPITNTGNTIKIGYKNCKLDIDTEEEAIKLKV